MLARGGPNTALKMPPTKIAGLDTPRGADIVDDKTCNGVVAGINTQHRQNHTGGGKLPNLQRQHIREEIENGIGLEGVGISAPPYQDRNRYEVAYPAAS